MRRLNQNKSSKINRILSKIISITMIVMMLMSMITTTWAASNDYDFWDAGRDWFKDGETNVYLDGNVLSQIARIVEVVGTGVISIATVVLGIRYVLGSATQKADVKDSMITLFVACIFFFGWSNLRTILIKGVTFSGVGVAQGGINGDSSVIGLNQPTLEASFGTIFGIVLTIAKIIALIATVYIGFKFVFSGADGKSQLKEKGIMYIIGIILIFATINVLSFVSDVATGL